MWLFIAVTVAQCIHDGMYKLPVLTYLDAGTIREIAMESNIPGIDEEEYAAGFIGSVFNKANEILLRYRVQLYMDLKRPIRKNIFINCNIASPLITFMKTIENHKIEKQHFNKLFIPYCDDFHNYLSLNHGIYNEYKDCTSNVGVMYVKNVILKQKVLDALLEMVARAKISAIDSGFESNVCRYINECVENEQKPIGEHSNYIHFLNNV